jgi:hypothetical protein
VRADLVARRGSDSVERALEPAVGERLDPAAVVADEMVMMLSRWQHRLKASGIWEVEALDEAETNELVEGAVDARNPDPPTVGA